MYELIKLTEKSYYINCPARMGIVRTGEDEVCLIDSGNDKQAGKKVLRILDSCGWKLKAIYNTHSNADHIGANRYLAAETGCEIYAPGIECDFTRHPILEPSFLYGGYPFSELRCKFLMAEPSDAKYLTEENLPKGLETINLKGHFFDMVGFRTDDGVVYLADCISSKETLDKYGICFIYDVAAYLETLRAVLAMDGCIFVPAHAEPCEDVTEIVNYNIQKVEEISDNIIKLCDTPLTFEELLKKLFDVYSLTMNYQQYALVGSTVRSYLAYLKDIGRLDAVIEDNRLLWKSI